MDQFTINKIIKSISPVSAWSLALTLSEKNGDGCISEDYFEEEYSVVFEYLISNITSEKLIYPLFEINFITQMGHLLLTDRISSIIDNVNEDLSEMSNYYVDINHDKSIIDEYSNSACIEICKMLSLTDKWAEIHDLVMKFPKI